MSYKYPILAKPSGITLEEHTNNVMSEGQLLLSNLPTTVAKYKEFVGKDLKKRLEIACKYHDEGKKTHAWQTACQRDYEDFLIWQQTHSDKSYNDYAAEHDTGAHIRKAKVRHEFHSLYANKTMPLLIQAAVAAHHGKLGFAFEDRWNEQILVFWENFKKEYYQIIEETSFEDSVKLFYEFAGVRGLLQLADHRASAKENKEDIPTIAPFHYTFPFSKKRGVQELVEQHWEDDLLLVRAPTGSGKTDASLLWASLQIEHKRAERLVIAMPTRFTSNALAINVADTLSDTGLYHSSAWFTRFQEGVDNQQISKRQADKCHEFARLLQTPITVCTIDHLLMALTLTREDHHLITFNLANACLVIDEADFYDDFTQANILVLLELLRCWKVPTLIMSASLSESVINEYQSVGYQIHSITEDTSDNQRIRFEVKEIRDYSAVDEIEDLLNLCIEKESAIVYANTVDKAKSFYDWFHDRGCEPIIYHSRFTEPDKSVKENVLINALGKEAWNNGNAHGIAILTQIGEMSINISADIMISDMCPIDRLSQRTGRLCRFNKEKIGELYLINPIKDGKLYPAPYGIFERRTRQWEALDSYKQTLALIEPKQYNVDTLVKLLNQIYSEQTLFSAKAKTNAHNLKEYFKCNMLITSKQRTNEDDTMTNFWQSRDIGAQDVVYVEEPTSPYFCNYLQFQGWKIRTSITLPVYMIEQARKNNLIRPLNIFVGDEKESINIVLTDCYSHDNGINFTNINDNFL